MGTGEIEEKMADKGSSNDAEENKQNSIDENEKNEEEAKPETSGPRFSQMGAEQNSSVKTNRKTT